MVPVALLPPAAAAFYLAALAWAVRLAVALSLLVSADRVLNVLKYAFIRLRARVTGRLPKDAWAYAALPDNPKEYPLVAVQLPMFNERAVCQAIIDCCAELEWPASRLMIQVLDDSTDAVTRELVDDKVLEWRERGVDVECLRRTNRQGYKAGAMKEGMAVLAAQGVQFVAVFDADFKPDAAFLRKTVPYLMGNAQLGYVQSRWVFTNPQESYLTKAQEVSLNYHMRCEQYTHSATRSFFNFNGTAGVWRLACIEGAGGWNARTTVEDMDLSLRAYLKGWSALFLDDVTCLNELPASFFAYRKQQHRWTCGPIQLWSKASADIWASQLPLPRKLELILLYFGVRKCATHLVSLGFFCTLLPLTVFTPQVGIPTWALVHLPVAVTLCTAAFTRRGLLYSILYVLFENAMGTVKLWAVVTGLLDLQRAQEWVVTTKLGSSDRRPGATGAPSVPMPSCKLYLNELGFALFFFAAGAYGLLAGTAHLGLAAYLLVQGFVFLAFAFNWVDAGGLLGGRLDEDVVRVPPSKAARALGVAGGGGVHGTCASVAGGSAVRVAREVKRAHTIPVIKLDSAERLPAMMEPAASSPAPLAPVPLAGPAALPPLAKQLQASESRRSVVWGDGDGASSPTSGASSTSGLADAEGAWGGRTSPYASSVDSSSLGGHAPLPLSSVAGGVPLSALKAALDAWAMSPEGQLDYYAPARKAPLAPPPRRSLVGMLFGMQAPAYRPLNALHNE